VARDRLEDLRDDHRAVGLVVDPLEQLVELRLGEEEAPILVSAALTDMPTQWVSAERTTTISASSLRIP